MVNAPSHFCLRNRHRGAAKAVVCALLFASLACAVGGLLAQNSASAPSRGAGSPGKGVAPVQEIEAAGEGATEDETFRQAVVDAVRQVVGTLVSAENVVSNEKVIKDQVLTLSNGFVEKIIKRERRKLASGTWEVKLRCLVRKGQVYDKLREANVPTVRFDGVSVFADVVSQLDHQKSSVGLILKGLETISPALVTAVMLEEKPKIIERSDKYTDVEITWRASVDLDAFFTKCTPALDVAFSGAATATSKKPIFVPVKSANESGTGYRPISVYNRPSTSASDFNLPKEGRFDFSSIAAVPVAREKSKWGIRFYQCDERTLQEVRRQMRSSWNTVSPAMSVVCTLCDMNGGQLLQVRMTSLKFREFDILHWSSHAAGPDTCYGERIAFSFMPLLESTAEQFAGLDQQEEIALKTEDISNSIQTFWSGSYSGSSVLYFRSRLRLPTAVLAQISTVKFTVNASSDGHRSPRLKGR